MSKQGGEGGLPRLPIEDDAEADRLVDMLPAVEDRARAIHDLRAISFCLLFSLHERDTTARAKIERQLRALDDRLLKQPPKSEADVVKALNALSDGARDALLNAARWQQRVGRKVEAEQLTAVGALPSRFEKRQGTAEPRTNFEMWVKRALQAHLPPQTWSASIAGRAEQIDEHARALSRVEAAYSLPDDESDAALDAVTQDEWDALGRVNEGKVLTSQRRPPDDDVRQAVRDLAELWEEQCVRRPTLTTYTDGSEFPAGSKGGRFHALCHAVIDPVRKAVGVKLEDLHNHIQAALSERRMRDGSDRDERSE